MCGVAGILQKTASQPLQKRLKAMSEAMEHRGPDGFGLWVSETNKVGLAHQRLAIVDLSDQARQPMSDKEKSVYVTFNGEIYNHNILREKLLARGHSFLTHHSDTEVLVHGYKEWGLDGLVKRLDGMFAFGLWDTNEQKFLLARDRIGIKPLYFCSHQDTFRFASEIKSILTDPSIPREMDPNALNHYLSFMVSPPPLTMFKHIYKLPAAHVMEVNRFGEIKTRRYWDVSMKNRENFGACSDLSNSSHERFYIDGVRSRLERAVNKRMMADVPFGVFLSGGIDSSINVALMKQLTNNPINTFTVGFKDHPHLNELPYARRIAKKFKTNHHEILINEKNMMDYLEKLVHFQDEPLADWVCIPLHFVSELAKKTGTKVVHVGEGADEQFCGYDSWMTYLKFFQVFWKPYSSLIPLPVSKMISNFSKVFAPSSRNRLAQFIESLHRASTNHQLFFSGANSIWEIHKPDYISIHDLQKDLQYDDLSSAGFDITGLCSNQSGDIINGYYTELHKLKKNPDLLACMAYSEFRLRLPELLLMRLDKIGMSNSIEARVPFLDHSLVEFSMKIPQEVKTRGKEKKYLLKKAFADLLPNDIIQRKKVGFSAPVSKWLRSDFGKSAEETILQSSIIEQGLINKSHMMNQFNEHRSGRSDHSLHIWTIFNLVSWHKHWIEGSAKTDSLL